MLLLGASLFRTPAAACPLLGLLSQSWRTPVSQSSSLSPSSPPAILLFASPSSRPLLAFPYALLSPRLNLQLHLLSALAPANTPRLPPLHLGLSLSYYCGTLDQQRPASRLGELDCLFRRLHSPSRPTSASPADAVWRLNHELSPSSLVNCPTERSVEAGLSTLSLLNLGLYTYLIPRQPNIPVSSPLTHLLHPKMRPSYI